MDEYAHLGGINNAKGTRHRRSIPPMSRLSKKRKIHYRDDPYDEKVVAEFGALLKSADGELYELVPYDILSIILCFTPYREFAIYILVLNCLVTRLPIVRWIDDSFEDGAGTSSASYWASKSTDWRLGSIVPRQCGWLRRRCVP